MSLISELERLEALHQRGALSADEYSQAKARLLAESAAATAAAASPALSAINRLHRSSTDRWIGGVCGGLAEVTGMATWLWRLAFALMFFCAGSGGLLYLLLWFFLPQGPQPLPPSRLQAG